MGRRAEWVREGKEEEREIKEEKRNRKREGEGRPPQERIPNQSYRIETWGESVQTTNQNSQTKKNFSFLSFLSFPPFFFLSVSFAFFASFLSLHELQLNYSLNTIIGVQIVSLRYKPTNTAAHILWFPFTHFSLNPLLTLPLSALFPSSFTHKVSVFSAQQFVGKLSLKSTPHSSF